MKQYKFDRNYLNLLIKNKDKLLDNDLVVLVTYIEVLQDKIEAYKNVIKEVIDYINEKTVFSIKGLDLNICDEQIEHLLNILNKIGSDK